MGGEFSTNGGREEMYTGFWCGYLRERDHLEDVRIDGKMIFK
jgi:hypothetical protein